MSRRRCDYCCNYDHVLADGCPHMASHLLDPSPRFNSLRAFVGVMDKALDRIGVAGPGVRAVTTLDTGEAA